jgi:hypothetical protein
MLPFLKTDVIEALGQASSISVLLRRQKDGGERAWASTAGSHGGGNHVRLHVLRGPLVDRRERVVVLRAAVVLASSELPDMEAASQRSNWLGSSGTSTACSSSAAIGTIRRAASLVEARTTGAAAPSS